MSPSTAVTFAANGWSRQRGNVREQLVPAVGACRNDRVGSVGGLDDRGCPRGGLIRALDRDGFHVAKRLRERERLQRQVVVRLDEEEDAHATPSCCMTSTTFGAASAPWPRISACLPCPSGTTSRSFSSFDSGPRRLDDGQRLRLRAQPARHRRIARQVQAFEHRQHRGQRHLVHVARAAGVALDARAAVAMLDLLQPGHDRQPERIRDADPHLVVARIRRLVAEQQQVERLLAAHCVDDRSRGRLRIPLGSVRLAAGSRGRRRSPCSRAAAPPPPPGRASARRPRRRPPRRSAPPPRPRTPRAG